MDDKAQMHMLEVVIIVGLLLISIYFVKGFNFTPYAQISQQNKIENLGDGILRSLDSVPDPSGKYSSLLTRYIADYIEDMQDDVYDGSCNEFIEYVNSSVLEGSIFDIKYVNISSYYKDSILFGKSINDEAYTITIYSRGLEVGLQTSSYRITVIDGHIYRVILNIYYNLG